MEIVLVGEPKSTQHCYKYTCRGSFASLYMDKKCKDLKEDYMHQAMGQVKGKKFHGPIHVRLDIFFGTKRKADLDNYNKLVLDSLSGVAWDDDSQIVDLHITKNYDNKNPRVKVTIYENDM